MCELADDSLILSVAGVNANERKKDQACSSRYGSVLKLHQVRLQINL